MVLGTGALEKVYGSNVQHVLNGALIASGNFSLASDIDVAFDNPDGHAFADIVVSLTKAAAGNAGETISLHNRPLNILSTNDPPIPSANYDAPLATQLVEPVTSQQFIFFQGVPIPTRDDSEWYIQNGTTVNIGATWDLDAIPWTWAAVQ